MFSFEHLCHPAWQFDFVFPSCNPGMQDMFFFFTTTPFLQSISNGVFFSDFTFTSFVIVDQDLFSIRVLF